MPGPRHTPLLVERKPCPELSRAWIRMHLCWRRGAWRLCATVRARTQLQCMRKNGNPAEDLSAHVAFVAEGGCVAPVRPTSERRAQQETARIALLRWAKHAPVAARDLPPADFAQVAGAERFSHATRAAHPDASVWRSPRTGRRPLHSRRRRETEFSLAPTAKDFVPCVMASRTGCAPRRAEQHQATRYGWRGHGGTTRLWDAVCLRCARMWACGSGCSTRRQDEVANEAGASDILNAWGSNARRSANGNRR